MAKKAELKAVLTLNNSAFARTIQNSIRLARRFTQQLKANPVKTLGLAALVGAEKALIGASVAAVAFKTAAVTAYTVIGVKAVKAAADMETIRAGFEALTGSAQKAGQRMQQLQSFAGKSPFEFDQVAKGAKMLDILTDGALSGAKSLEMIGNVAAGTQREFADTAETIGQLYAALRIGLPIGDQLMQLRNTGAITDFGSKRIAQISTAGTPKAAAEAWKQVVQEFSRLGPQSQKMAGTWNGMATQFHNAIQLAFSQIGEPLLEALKPGLESAINILLSHKEEFAAMGEAFAKPIIAATEAIGLLGVKEDSLMFKFGQALGPKGPNAVTPFSQSGISGGEAAAEAGRRGRAAKGLATGGEAAALAGVFMRTQHMRRNFLGPLSALSGASTGSSFFDKGFGTMSAPIPGSSATDFMGTGMSNSGRTHMLQFGNPLGEGPKRANNFLRFGERRAIDNRNRATQMALIYAANGYTGNGHGPIDAKTMEQIKAQTGMSEEEINRNNTKVRRGDRQRMQAIAREGKRKEDEALSNRTFGVFMQAFDTFATKMGGK